MQPQTNELDDLRHRLRLLRASIAKLKKPELADVEALLSVAEAELERFAPEQAARLR